MIKGGVRYSLLAFLTAFVVLGSQVLVHRAVSAKLLNNFAFLVISLTMFGFTASALFVWKHLAKIERRFPDFVNLCVSGYAVSVVGCTWAFYRAPIDVGDSPTQAVFFRELMTCLPLAFLYAIPFTFLGAVLAALLSSRRYATRQIYFADLVGSALGAVVVLPLISWGVENSLLLLAALSCSVTWLALRPQSRWVQGVVAGSLLFVGASSVWKTELFQIRYSERSMLGAKENGRPSLVIETAVWDPVSRIEVSVLPKAPDPATFHFPSLIGSNPRFLSLFRRMITQNNHAFTYALQYDGNPASLRGIEETIYAAAYEATSVKNPKVVTVGVGGGFDLLTAIAYDAREVTGVEVNRATVRILTDVYRDYFKPLLETPQVKLIAGEGREFLSRSPDLYDVIQLSGVDSYSGTPGAAHVFSESFLYTLEAMKLYLSRLTPDGILNMMRLEYRPPREMMRALTTAVLALREAGVQKPADHILMVTQTNGFFTAMLVKKTPFTPAETLKLERWANASPYFKISAGGQSPPDSLYQKFLSLKDPELEQTAVDSYSFDIHPATDDMPFFFRHSYWWHLIRPTPVIQAASIPYLEYTLILLGGLITLAAGLFLGLPLLRMRATGLSRRRMGRAGLYFAALGLGYLAVEIAFLQIFGLFLGHPNYALSVVLAGLLFASGIGALLSERILSALGGIPRTTLVLSAILLIEKLVVLDHLGKWVAWPYPAKTLFVLGLICPVGLLLGVYLPAALDRLKGSAPGIVPWAWGINGIFSVLAPVLAIALAVSWGSTALLMSAIPIYLLASVLFPKSARA